VRATPAGPTPRATGHRALNASRLEPTPDGPGEDADARPWLPLGIGLTGGVAAGKSTVAALFGELGATLIDMDAICRALLAPATPATRQVLQTFELKPDAGGGVDRAELRRHVLAAPAARKQLEAILHPLAFAEVERRWRAGSSPYCIISIPLLVESDAAGRVHRTLLVDCPRTLQVTRLRRQRRLQEWEIEALLKAQASRAERQRHADDCIDNSGDPAALRPRVQELHRRYLQLAARRRAGSRDGGSPGPLPCR